MNYLSQKGSDISSADIQIDKSSVGLSKRVEEMDRVRKKIAEHMVYSQQTSPHVYSTIEADVTDMVNCRNSNKDNFQNKYGVKLTYTPIILNTCVNAIKKFPLINTSLEDDKIIHHDNINLGIAVALPDNNLIVPVIKASEDSSTDC